MFNLSRQQVLAHLAKQTGEQMRMFLVQFLCSCIPANNWHSPSNLIQYEGVDRDPDIQVARPRGFKTESNRRDREEGTRPAYDSVLFAC